MKNSLIDRIHDIQENRFQPLVDLDNIKQGAHGRVIICFDQKYNRKVAIKEIIHDAGEQLIPTHAIREIAAYRRIKSHINIVECFEIFGQSPLYFCMTAMMSSLKPVIREHSMSKAIKQSVKRQIANGMSWCHEQRIMHRDLKPDNILIDMNNHIRIADFGLATIISPSNQRSLSLDAVTLWYRPLELLLGKKFYNEKIDVWALGCVYYEIDNAYPLFRGDSKIGQIMEICKLLGSPNDNSMPEFSKFDFSLLSEFPKFHENSSSKLTELVKSTLSYDDSKRPNMFQILTELNEKGDDVK